MELSPLLAAVRSQPLPITVAKISHLTRDTCKMIKLVD